jgi:hypothetical protein
VLSFLETGYRRLAWRLYKACKSYSATLEVMNDFYSSWDKLWNTRRVRDYYNIRLGKFAFNKGAILYRMELAKPKENITNFGIEPTGCQRLRKFILEKLRRLKYKICLHHFTCNNQFILRSCRRQLRFIRTCIIRNVIQYL